MIPLRRHRAGAVLQRVGNFIKIMASTCGGTVQAVFS
jgi:hypothetical protein